MASEAPVVEGLKVGQRVQSANPEKGPQLGTVKYIGPVDGYEGLWIGVDWDSGRGRHDGNVNGKHYFETSGKESGSLVRPQSLCTGVTVVEALVRRYNATASATGSEEDDMYVMSVRQRRMAVELVGKDRIEARQKQLRLLEVSSLEYAGVNSAGPPGQISALVPNIKELDLTGNLLPDLLAVSKICVELSSLEVLNLSCSRPHISSDSSLQTPLNVKTLVLNNCQITWKQVELLKDCLASVEELHLCGNRLQTIEASVQDSSTSPGTLVHGFESLRLLNLEDNCIENWEEVMNLSKLPRLEHLNLNSNRIDKVFYAESCAASSTSEMNGNQEAGDAEFDRTPNFWRLRSLLLGRNKIADWASINSLDKFPTLTDLRLTENPITSPGTGGAPRYMLIACIQKLTSLNGSEVKPRERRDAEIRYVRHVLSDATAGSNEAHEKMHPRFKELRLIHDVPVEFTQLQAGFTAQKMSATLLLINIQCVSSSAGEKASISKRLPASTTVGKLKQICEGMFKVEAAKQQLYIRDQDPLPVALNNDMENLNDLAVGPSTVFLVDEINA